MPFFRDLPADAVDVGPAEDWLGQRRSLAGGPLDRGQGAGQQPAISLWQRQPAVGRNAARRASRSLGVGPACGARLRQQRPAGSDRAVCHAPQDGGQTPAGHRYPHATGEDRSEYGDVELHVKRRRRPRRGQPLPGLLLARRDRRHADRVRSEWGEGQANADAGQNGESGARRPRPRWNGSFARWARSDWRWTRPTNLGRTATACVCPCC